MAQIVHTKINVQRKITSILLCQLCFNFLLYHTSKIQPLASNLKLISKILYECIRTFEYFPIWIFVRIIFVSFFWYEYIRIFIRLAFLIRIYSDIPSYCYLDINIFEYLFVSKIYICHTSTHPDRIQLQPNRIQIICPPRPLRPLDALCPWPHSKQNFWKILQFF